MTRGEVLWWILTGIFAVLALAAWFLRNTPPFRDNDYVALALTAASAGIAAFTVKLTLTAQKTGEPELEAITRHFRSQVEALLSGSPHGYFTDPHALVPVHFRDATAPDVTVTTPLGDYFDSLPKSRSRLLILGPPGSGKTVAATQLTEHLLKKATGPVPVRVTLSDWPLGKALVDWLAEHLKERGLTRTRAAARALLKAGRILPILDGLDEMDPSDVPARDSRALQALRRINEGYSVSTGKVPLVVVCRDQWYRALRRKVRLENAAVVTLQRLDSEQQLTFLRSSGLQDETGRWIPEWRRTAEALTWTGEPLGLARVLDTPWKMALLTTVYKQMDQDHRFVRSPDEDLMRRAPHEVPEHLLGLYVEAATTTWNVHVTRRYEPAQVEEWLGTLARHLQRGGGRSEGEPSGGGDDAASETDLVLHRLWPLAGFSKIVSGELLLALLCVTASVNLAERLGFVIPADSLLSALLLYGTANVLPMVVASSSHRQPVPRRLEWQQMADWRTAGWTLLCAVALTPFLLDGLRERPVLYAAILVGYVLPLPVLSATLPVADRPHATLTGPRDPLRAELRFALVVTVVVSLWVGAWFAQWLTESGWGFLFGLLIACIPAFSLSARAWRRYLAFKFSAAHPLPWRLGSFLDWACDAGLMRVEGLAYQFRHRELQEHLARSAPDPSLTRP